MNSPRHNSALWSKWTIILIAAAILLLITGASPILGVPAVYKSAPMLLIGLFTAVLSLFAAFFIRGRNIGLCLLHAGSFLILAGAYMDFVSEQKMTGSFYVGEEYYPNSAGQTHAPDFRFVIRDFKVDYYSLPVYALMEGKTRQELEEGVITNDAIVFPDHHLSLPLARMEAVASTPHPFLFLEGSKLVYMKKPAVEKYYEADFLITDQDSTHEYKMAVNHPVTHNGWRFYLMNHGKQDNRQIVSLIVRHAPGRLWVKTGILLLVAGTFLFSFFRRKRKENTLS